MHFSALYKRDKGLIYTEIWKSRSTAIKKVQTLQRHFNVRQVFIVKFYDS